VLSCGAAMLVAVCCGASVGVAGGGRNCLASHQSLLHVSLPSHKAQKQVGLALLAFQTYAIASPCPAAALLHTHPPQALCCCRQCRCWCCPPAKPPRLQSWLACLPLRQPAAGPQPRSSSSSALYCRRQSGTIGRYGHSTFRCSSLEWYCHHSHLPRKHTHIMLLPLLSLVLPPLITPWSQRRRQGCGSWQPPWPPNVPASWAGQPPPACCCPRQHWAARNRPLSTVPACWCRRLLRQQSRQRPAPTSTAIFGASCQLSRWQWRRQCQPLYRCTPPHAHPLATATSLQLLAARPIGWRGLCSSTSA
jgi:hypothetical protein